MGFEDFAKRFVDPGNYWWDKPSNAPTVMDNQGQFQGLINAGFGAQQPTGTMQQAGANVASMFGAGSATGQPAMGQGITNYAGQQLQMGSDPFRQAQLQQMGQLQRIAAGQQQGAGELAAQRQVANAIAAQQAQARMARGGNAALAARNAANQSAALGISGAGLGQQAALQDQQGAQGQLAGLTNAGRQNDISVANANAGFAQNANQLNSGNYLQLLSQLNQRNIAKYNADLGIGAQQNAADAQKSGGLMAGIGGALSLFSDENLKTDVADADGDIDDMLDKLTPKSFRYKSERHGQGEWSGVMAQDMERSSAGRRVVREVPGEGKALDTNKTISTLLAATARLNKRLREVEGK
jgi:hypothetical protein